MAQKDPYTPPADNQGINSGSKGGEGTGSGTSIEGMHTMNMDDSYSGDTHMDFSSMKGEGNTSSSNDDGVSQPTSHKYKCDKSNAFTPGA